MIVINSKTNNAIFRSTIHECKREFPKKTAILDSGETVDVEFQYELTIEEQSALLTDTDWYVIRSIERGVDVPEDISSLRQTAVEFLNS